MEKPSLLVRLVPLFFVLLWSTGFIGARYGLPWSEPFHLLLIRVLLTLAVFLLLIFIFRAQWPTRQQIGQQLLVGLLVHAGYLGGVFAAIKMAMPAGVAALIVGLQPLLTALLAWISMDQRLLARQWLGLAIGFLGVALVLGSGMAGKSLTLHPWAVVAAGIALFSISTGTLYQKRHGGQTDLLTGSFFQYLSTAICMALLAFTCESGTIVWHPQLIGAVLWLVFGLSVGAILLLMLMIRRGEVARVASYFYLVPPLTAIEAWWLFDERLSALALLGIGLTMAGVYLMLARPQLALTARK